MSARRVSLVVAAFTMAASGWYVAVYLARWEWNRALIAGVIFVAAEIALLGVLLLDRVVRLERRLDQPRRSHGAVSRAVDPAAVPRADVPRHPRRDPDPRVLDRLRDAAPPGRKPFAWLSNPANHTTVFVPVLLGAGVILSAAAWAVERVGRLSGGGSIDRHLAGRLDTLALPPRGLLGEDPDVDPFSPAS